MHSNYTEYTVYMHVNKITSKTYVGITHFLNPNKRWGYKGKSYNHSILFMRAINKYGWDAFSHIVLCRTSKEKAIMLERTLIAFYKRKNRSYNIGLGGEGSESFAPETIAKLKSYTPWIKGKHHTKEVVELMRERGRRPCKEETKRKISIANSGFRNGMYGKPCLEKTKLASIKKLAKPVLQFSINGDFIREYISTAEAERILGAKGGHISCVCKGRRTTAYGYKWKYKDE